VDAGECVPERPCLRSAEPEVAIDALVTRVMGLPTKDERFADIRDVLRGHFDAAVEAGNTASDALASTFVLACSSPSSSAIGL
jgi:hypothetical protein